MIALNYKWCHFRRGSSECQMCDTFLGPLAANIHAQGSMHTGETLDEVCQAQGGRTPSPLASLGRTLANRWIFSTPSSFSSVSLFDGSELGAEIYSLTSVLRNIFSPSLSKSLHILYFLLVNFPIRPAPVPLI